MRMLSVLRGQKGAIAVLAALSMSVVIGFTAVVVDLGILFLHRSQLANIADAAALAGAQELPGNPQTAELNAALYAEKNGKPGDTVETSVRDGGKSLYVKASRNVSLMFAKIFSLSSSTVSASATAQVRAIRAYSGAVPFGVEKQNFTLGQTYNLKEGGGSGYNGNYGGLALGGNGANAYRENIKQGYSGQLAVGQWVSTEPGNMSGPTSDGVNYRINQDPTATYAALDKNSPRVVVVPILESLAVHGRKEVQIVGFASFFLEGIGGSGNDSYVYGKFISMVVPGDIANPGSDTGYGLYGTTLVK